jgi:hypothetical protein
VDEGAEYGSALQEAQRLGMYMYVTLVCLMSYVLYSISYKKNVRFLLIFYFLYFKFFLYLIYLYFFTYSQLKGFAESDPTADVEGHDVQAKIAILAKLAFGKTVPSETVPTTGISRYLYVYIYVYMYIRIILYYIIMLFCIIFPPYFF